MSSQPHAKFQSSIPGNGEPLLLWRPPANRVAPFGLITRAACDRRRKPQRLTPGAGPGPAPGGTPTHREIKHLEGLGVNEGGDSHARPMEAIFKKESSQGRISHATVLLLRDSLKKKKEKKNRGALIF